MTKQHPLCLSVARSDEIDGEHSDNVGMNIKSPAFLPCKEWSFAEPIALPPSALNGHGDHAIDVGHGLVAKPSSPHKLSKCHKFPSMSNLCLAGEEAEGEAATPASPPKTPHAAPMDKPHFSDSQVNGSGPARMNSTDCLNSNGGSPKAATLDHTVGTIPSWSKMRKSRSVLDVKHLEEALGPSAVAAVDSVPAPFPEDRPGRHLLFVLDMDHTMVGNLVALSDRDNIETNVEWDYWPEGSNRGLSVEDIIPYLERGMLRPGLTELLQHLRGIGATVVVYTHSERKWASKVCEAMQRIAGWPFIARLFSRMDCRDGHPHFLARKSLEHVVTQLHEEEGYRWSKVELSLMFDDDRAALNGSEQHRLIQVPSYDYWEPCPWNTVVTPEVMDRNGIDVNDKVRRSVVEWGIAEPSYVEASDDPKTAEEEERDRKWAAQQRRKQNILLSYNKVAKLDRVMHNVREVLMAQATFDDDTLEALPDRVRAALGDSHGAAGAAGATAAGLGRRAR